LYEPNKNVCRRRIGVIHGVDRYDKQKNDDQERDDRPRDLDCLAARDLLWIRFARARATTQHRIHDPGRDDEKDERENNVRYFDQIEDRPCLRRLRVERAGIVGPQHCTVWFTPWLTLSLFYRTRSSVARFVLEGLHVCILGRSERNRN